MHGFQDTMLADLALSGAPENAQQSRFWGDQWLRVSEKLLKGLNHQFTNRLTALGALLDLMRPGSPPDDHVVDALSEEVARLGRLLRLYRSLGSDGLTAIEATRMQDVIPAAIALHEHHPDLKFLACRVDGDPECAPILVRQACLLRSMLVLLENVAGTALRADRSREMQVTFGSSADDVFVRFEGPAPLDQLLFSGDGSLLQMVRRELAHASGTADGTVIRSGPDVRLQYEIRLPTLSVARRSSQPTA